MEDYKNKDLSDECYDEWWLSKDMENMGYIFEYCVKYCIELYNVYIDKKRFLNDFMCSNIRREMETGHPRLLSQSAFDTIKAFVKYEKRNRIEQYKSGDFNEYEEYGFNQFYWVGWMYAYIHFCTKLSSRNIIARISLDEMLDLYYLGHEMDKTVFFEHIRDYFE